jgi:NAD(P)-dependent dehydrogenase (short-subunit alcohol dehydrogenase family)
MEARLKDKVAIVTGAASGIGRGCAQRLAQEGASVMVADINEQGGRETVAQITGAGGRASYLAIDVTNEDSWIDAIAMARSEYGALHVLLNNAGIGISAPLTEMTYADWRLQFAVNLDAHFLGMKHAIPLMTQSGGGSIINISSAAGMKTYATMSAYCASKGGVRHLTKVAALECAQNRTGIRVNSIHPGIVKTPAWDHLDTMVVGGGLDAMAETTVPMGYVGTPDDVASAVIFLASDESRYITGTELMVDGGQALG